jgi:excisionase family DNA binding protein
MSVTKRWLSVEEFAPQVDASTDMVYRWIRDGKFPFRFVRMGRLIKIDAVDAGIYEGPQRSEQIQAESLPKTA